MRNHLNVFFQRDTSGKLLLFFVLWSESQSAVDKLLVRAVTKTEFGQLRPPHQPVDVPDSLAARVRAYLTLAAHDDCFLRTGIHAETTEHATQHVDVKPRRVLFNQRIGMLGGFDVYAIGWA